MKKRHILVFLACCLLFFAACSQPNQYDSNSGGSDKAESSTDMGTLKISFATTALPEVEINKSVNVGKIQYYKFTIKGNSTAPITEIIPLGQIGTKTYSLKVQKNLVVKAEPLDALQQPFYSSGKYMVGYTDIIRNQNNVVTINWATTPVGLMLESLFDKSASLQVINPAPMQAKVDLLWGKSFLNGKSVTPDNYFNPLAANIEASVLEWQTNPASDILHQYGLSTVKVTISGYSAFDKDGMTAMINEPFAPPVEIDPTTDTFIFNNIAPGAWNVTLSADTSGSYNVTVPETTGTIPVTIANTNNKPALYDWQLTAFNDNGVHKVMAAASAADEDGDPLSVIIHTADGTTDINLIDNGSSSFYDTKTGDGIYESITPVTAVAGNFDLIVSDGKYTDNYTKNMTLTFLDLPVISSITEGEVVTITQPELRWGQVSTKAYYRIELYNADTSENLYTQSDIAGTTTSLTMPLGLSDGNYRIKMYAYSNNWFFPLQTGFPYMQQLSASERNFSVNASGTLVLKEPELGLDRVLYYSTPKELYKIDIHTKQEQLVYTSQGDINFLALSPDGQVLLFEEGGDLYKIRGNGKAKFKLFSLYGRKVIYAKWSPVGDKILVGVENGFYDCDLYTIKSDGSEKENHTTRTSRGDFSLDGKNIYYMSGSNIYKKDLTTGQLTYTSIYKSSYISPWRIQVSPDGKRLLGIFYSNEGSIQSAYKRIHTYDINNYNNNIITSSGYVNRQPETIKWARDGRIEFNNMIFEDLHSSSGEKRISTTIQNLYSPYFVMGPSGQYFFFAGYKNISGSTDKEYFIGYSSVSNLGQSNSTAYVTLKQSVVNVQTDAVKKIMVSPVNW